MPAWAINTQAALSAGDNLQVLLVTDTSGAGGALKGFSFTPQATPINLAIWNNSGQTIVLQASPDNATWLPVTLNGVAVSVATGLCLEFSGLAAGLNYRLANAVAITAGGTVWVAR
jgi:hypothetical protein